MGEPAQQDLVRFDMARYYRSCRKLLPSPFGCHQRCEAPCKVAKRPLSLLGGRLKLRRFVTSNQPINQNLKVTNWCLSVSSLASSGYMIQGRGGACSSRLFVQKDNCVDMVGHNTVALENRASINCNCSFYNLAAGDQFNRNFGRSKPLPYRQ